MPRSGYSTWNKNSSIDDSSPAIVEQRRIRESIPLSLPPVTHFPLAIPALPRFPYSVHKRRKRDSNEFQNEGFDLQCRDFAPVIVLVRRQFQRESGESACLAGRGKTQRLCLYAPVGRAFLGPEGIQIVFEADATGMEFFVGFCSPIVDPEQTVRVSEVCLIEDRDVMMFACCLHRQDNWRARSDSNRQHPASKAGTLSSWSYGRAFSGAL